MSTAYKPTVCLDFDGVIHSYTSPWQGDTHIPDPPVAGDFSFIRDLLASDFRVAVFSTRSKTADGLAAMQRWFLDHGCDAITLSLVDFPTDKPPAVLYVDDRGYCFCGVFPSIEFIQSFRPWNK